jgi:hypothetical protein
MMYIYLKYSIYKKNMRLAAICINYYNLLTTHR